MRQTLFGLLCLGLCGQATAETLPLPESLIALNSDNGQALLIEAEARADYFDLAIHFTNQVHPAFCGPASIAMVLNALDVPRPASDMTLGLGMFDQENVFTPATEAVKPRARIERAGLTLDELGRMFEAHSVAASVHHAADSSLEEFRRAAIDSIGDAESFVLVNYLRSSLGQERGGHISPLGAYDAETDRFLILDVTRYKYPPVWVDAAALFDAMNTPDSDNDDRSRGYLLVVR
ncbi:phytochelatin synthase family protein [Defluviimonas sp. WL0024]|uniref:glutathione gamma-glutamylcysteinyltransferase n=2 Tax=Albidovulum TaxID=205889 RepID=A0ABT3J0I0_9RHOB|nr:MULTISPECIES: phytochelatin synthase family protein [Defluviimonas]MCU9847139.1 phytochelatin synthase family protein [Defluviimonas sp. WL0024]MCW3780939.1 phytochelatin synthase family protein [Defluviimonas salinarum]